VSDATVYFDHNLVQKRKAGRDLVLSQQRPPLQIAGEYDEIQITAAFPDGGRFAGGARGINEPSAAEVIINRWQQQEPALGAFDVFRGFNDAPCTRQPAHRRCLSTLRQRMEAKPEGGARGQQVGVAAQATVVK
jgi:hypothetical protein